MAVIINERDKLLQAAPSRVAGVTLQSNVTVVAANIGAGAVTTTKIADAAVVSTKINDGAVTTAKIVDAAISAAKFASGLEPVSIVSALPSATGYTGPKTVLLTTDNKLYRYTGTAWTGAVPAADLTGQITETQITDGAISTPKLAAGSVVTAKLAAAAVTANEIATDAVTANKILAGSVTAAKMAADSITAGNGAIANLTVDTIKIANFAVSNYFYADLAFPAIGSSTDISIGTLPANSRLVVLFQVRYPLSTANSNWGWFSIGLNGTGATAGGSGSPLAYFFPRVSAHTNISINGAEFNLQSSINIDGPGTDTPSSFVRVKFDDGSIATCAGKVIIIIFKK